MDEKTAELIQMLAQKYETPDFLRKDPSQFMHRYEKISDIECAAFIAANLAFGRREQILSHVELILTAAGKNLSDWILSSGYKDFFPKNEKSFYRMYTNCDMLSFFDAIKAILEKNDTLGDFFKKSWEENERLSLENGKYLHIVVAKAFPDDCKLIPRCEKSAAKKVNMLLRWLVRVKSPVDIGLWTWYSPKKLLIPLDTHVMQQSNELDLIKSKSANLCTAVELTKKVTEVFPDDPVKADFALFGLGIDLQNAR